MPGAIDADRPMIRVRFTLLRARSMHIIDHPA
jgi:hypothetical protein